MPRLVKPDDVLQKASSHIVFHIRTYVETYLWLESHPRISEWDTERNAMIDSHLVAVRMLINFLKADGREDDVIAVDYFHDLPSTFASIKKATHAFLFDQSIEIGGRLVHITTKNLDIKSNQSWDIGTTAKELKPELMRFLAVVPHTRFSNVVAAECLAYLQRLNPPTPLAPIVTISAST